MTEHQNNRWLANEQAFAQRVEIHDVSGFFHKTLRIEPGTRAMILERGESLGEVQPGEYTLEGLVDRLKFWSRKSLTAILTREGEVPLDLVCPGLATREFLEVEVRVRLLIQIDDVALFQKNLLGSRSSLALMDLQQIVLPIVQQSLWESIGRFSITDLTGPLARTDLELRLGQSLGTSLARNGLKFTHVQALAVAHPEYDEQRQKVGTLFLQRVGADHDQAAAELAADNLLAQIQRQEKLNDLEILTEQVAADRMEGELAIRLRRSGIRRQLREAARAGYFDKVQSAEEVARFLQQRDKERILRDEEFASLAETLKNQTADRASVRSQLLRKLDLEQQAELQGVRIELDFAQKRGLKRHEMALAELNESDESRRWRTQIEREAALAENRRAEELKQVAHDRDQALMFATDGRVEEFEEVQHQLRIDRVQGDLELAQAERRHRIALLSSETRQAQEAAEGELLRRKGAIEHEINQNLAMTQLEKLKQVQELNIAGFKAQAEMRLTVKRTEAEIEELKRGNESNHEIARLRELKGFDKYGLIATAHHENAALLAETLKAEAIQVAVVETAKANASAAMANDARVAELRAQMTDQQRLQHDQMMATMQEFVQSQGAGFGQFGAILQNVTQNLAPQSAPSPTVIVAGNSPANSARAASPHDEGGRTVVCAGCRTENREIDRFCRQCGKPL